MRVSFNALVLCIVACGVLTTVTADDAKTPAAPAKNKPLVMFDGKTLTGWKSTNFGGEGDVSIDDGAIVMDFGSDMTGVTWQKEEAIPKSNYEVTFKASRIDGGDFFCGLTFPVKKEHCSLILGGWGGGVCGLSSLDGLDASENTTTSYREFKPGQWYDIKLQVLDKRIRVWLDGKEIIDQDISDKKISVRGEVELSKPFGFSTWRTRGAVKSIELKTLTEADLKTANAPAKKAS